MNSRLMNTLVIADQLLEEARLRIRTARTENIDYRPAKISSVRELIEQRRLRDDFFAPGLFADPAWDLLLDLAAARLEGQEVSITSACIAAHVPSTTALRWINVLISQKLIEREPDARDKRRVNVRLTERGWDAMSAYLRRIGVLSDYAPREH